MVDRFVDKVLDESSILIGEWLIRLFLSMLSHVVVNHLIRFDVSFSNHWQLRRAREKISFSKQIFSTRRRCVNTVVSFLLSPAKWFTIKTMHLRSASLAVVVLLIMMMMMMMMMMTTPRRRRTATTIVAFYYSHWQAVTRAQTVGRETNEKKSGRRRVGARNERKKLSVVAEKSCKQQGGWEKKRRSARW